jgi:hypothetical protein
MKLMSGAASLAAAALLPASTACSGTSNTRLTTRLGVIGPHPSHERPAARPRRLLPT